ncbi:hypothetical protein [Hyalangium versicolor]|uniref:hypothetical protein n=1 Tax=Hyalangium versicolor TaxID=2861190 RepID=UPI001CCFC0FA|nr:hypothetical protein [Hyalangium versicolor]
MRRWAQGWGLVMTLVASGAAAAPTARPMFHWDVPGLLQWVDAAGVQVSDGVPIRLDMARSKLPVEELVQHFANAFQKAGLFIPPDSARAQALQQPQLTALDPERMVAYTVIFQRNPDKTVTLLLGTSDLSHYEPAKGSSLDWAPLPPEAQVMVRTDMEGGQSAVFSIAASEAQVMAFYRDTMKQAGFVEEEPGQFRRGSETIHVFTQSQDGRLSVSLTRHLGEQGGALTR